MAGVCLSLKLAALALSLACCAGQSDLTPREDELQEELKVLACQVNNTILKGFRNSVQERYGWTGVRNRFAAVARLSNTDVKCYADCPNATVEDITWCVHIFHPVHDITLCKNISGVVNASQIAVEAGLLEHFEVPESAQDCARHEPNCLKVLEPGYYLHKAYFYCSIQTDSCFSPSFVSISVIVEGHQSNGVTMDVSSHPRPSSLLLGGNQTNYLVCEVHFPTINRFGDVTNWTREGAPLLVKNGTAIQWLEIITEDPFCDPTVNDSCRIDQYPGHQELKQDRVRIYQQTYVINSCPTFEETKITWLFIDNATMDDLGNYTCSTSNYFFNPLPHQRFLNKTLILTGVPPLVDVVPLSLPPLPSPSSPPLLPGADIVWTVLLQAGSQDTVQWTLNNTALPITHYTDTNCSVALSSAGEDDLPLDNVFVYHRRFEEEGEDYTARYESTLLVCGVSERNGGTYAVSVTTANRGDVELLWSRDVQVLKEERGQGSQSTVVVIATLCSLLLVVLVVAVLLGLFTRWRRHKAYTPDKSIFPDVIQTPYSKSGDELLFKVADPMEFPRSRLHLFADKVLGEGTFGRVLQARAEGIVAASPYRNIVAVKTIRENAPLRDEKDLWEELQLMKGMEAHENILNLLGQCTIGGPLYLIVEYAVHGSLKDFLKQCETVVQQLTSPPTCRATTRQHSVGSCSSTSSGYPLLGSNTAAFSPYYKKDSYLFALTNTPITPNNSKNSLDPKSTLSTTTGAAAKPSTEDTHVTFSLDETKHKRAEEDSSKEDRAGMAVLAPGVSPTSLAHSVAPLLHDYANCKGVVYMEDVQNFALQIACGLQHLEKLQIVHCDLAARNVLIAEGFVLKIADFGMARDLGEKEYYRKHTGGRIPVKWTAPEALEQHIFTFKSDIWSYAVVLWELFTYAKMPYPDVKIKFSWDPFISYLKDGHRLPQPHDCPDTFYDLMQHCWQLDPEERPAASDIVALLSNQAPSSTSPASSPPSSPPPPSSPSPPSEEECDGQSTPTESHIPMFTTETAV